MSDEGRITAVGAPGRERGETTPLTLTRTPISTAWNVQGTPEHAPFIDEDEKRFDVRLPSVPNTTARGSALLALWLGQSSWLLMQTVAEGSSLVDFEPKRDALNACGGALFEVSASRVAFTLGGKHATTVLAKSCPLDFHTRAFPVGGCAQSLYGHVNALFYRVDAQSFTMLVARSFARDVWHTLSTSAAQYGHDDALSSEPPIESSPQSRTHSRTGGPNDFLSRK